MLRRLLLALVLLVAVAGVLLLRRPPRAAVKEVPATAAAGPDEAATGRDLGVHPPKPDARFLEAVGVIERIVAGNAATPVDCAFEHAGWTVRSGERVVGRVGASPGYAERLRLLVGWARALGAPGLLAESDIDVSPGTAQARRRGHAAIEGAIGSLHAVRAALLADRLWAAGHRDPATARLGARALAWMSAQCFTGGGAGDAVGARALAWLAIAAACDSVAIRREAALLAQSLADSVEAVAAAAGLADEDPIRLAALGRDEVLGAIASRGLEMGGAARTREARWLALRRAVDRRELEAWNLAAMRGLDQDAFLALPLLASRRAIEHPEASVSSDTRVLLAVGSDLRLNDLAPAPIAGGGERTHADVIALFETLLESMPESADGVFLDRQVLRGWYRAPFDASRTPTASRPAGDASPVRAFAAPVEVRSRPARRLG